jgi:phosphotransferase system HPr-like phosphotransfer protein
MFKVKLDIDNIKNFLVEVMKIDSDVSLVSGKYVVNAKSIMGIYSLDLSNPIDVVLEEEAESECETLYNRLKELNIAI